MDDAARTASMSQMQDVSNAFGDLMEFAEAAIRAVLADGPVFDVPTQVKLTVATHAFDLLCSAWDDAMVGRHSAATDHWRSISEAPRFIMAMQINPDLASQMVKPGVSISTVVRTIRKGLKAEIEKRGGGLPLDRAALAWVNDIADELKSVRPFAHVDFRAASAGQIVVRRGDSEVRFINPGGGATSPESFGLVVCYLADGAISLAAALAFAFPNVPAIGESYSQGGGKELFERAKTLLTSKAISMGINLG